jgi:hypothetical protein
VDSITKSTAETVLSFYLSDQNGVTTLQRNPLLHG